MLREVSLWLGEGRVRALLVLLGVTGLASVLLQVGAPDQPWSLSAQTGLVLVFLLGAVYIIAGRLTPVARRSMLIRVLPALGALALGAIIPNLLPLFLGAGFGWLLVSQFALRDTEQREYKLAIKAMRHQDYKAAIEQMNTLIDRDPKDARHYAFRAQLFRLKKDLRRAHYDYQQVIALAPETGVGQNGLAELFLQEDNLPEARKWGEAAYAQAPQDWVALYNLGMIAERQQDHTASAEYLQTALDLGLPDSRHRLLTKLWLTKSLYRLGKQVEAQQIATQMKREKSGLSEWKTILGSDEADSVRHLLQEDIRQAEILLLGEPLNKVFHATG